MESHSDKTRQVITIASLDDTPEKSASRFPSFPSPCRIFCGKGDEADSACLVHEKLKDHISCCADKTASIIKAHPLKSMAVTGIVALLIGRYFFRKP